VSSSMIELTRALRAFDAPAFTQRHGGRKESQNPKSQEYMLNCPLCGGHNLRWNPTRGQGMGGWVCWNCKTSGNTLYLVQLFERVALEDAIAYVMGEYNGGDAQLELTDIARMPEVQVSQMPKLQRLPTMHWPSASVDARYHPSVRAYLHGRGVDDAMIEQWQIRAGTRGREKNHVIFPVFMDGGLVYWQARAAWDPPPHLTPEQKKAWVKATRYRKTLNPINAMPGIPRATAGEVLFNYDRASRAGHVVICEGPVDAIKVGPHAVALLGKGTDTKVARLRRMGARRYTVYLDRGEEERAKAEQIAADLAGWAEVYIATPPARHDPGSLTPEQNANVVERAEPAGEIGLKSALKPA
jgi:hypothetical protein